MYNITISHVSSDDKRIQTNESHLQGVGELAYQFAEEFGMGLWGRVIGSIHDIGKERQNFQNYIRKKTGIDPNAKWRGEDKRHAYVGALWAKEMYKNFYTILSYPIMGHHSGLDDYADFEEKMKALYPNDVNKPKKDVDLALPCHIVKALAGKPENLSLYMHHIIRMLYSCLVDADYLDTEEFMNPASAKYRKDKLTMKELLPKLETHLNNIKENSVKSRLNTLRQQIQDRCRELSTAEPGFYNLTVPTGGGKTLSSILWGMLHCIQHSKRRIIIAIPYTSIVTQTANTLKDIFGQENVLEHHSNFDINEIENAEMEERIKLATENWDYPIIVTTNVQLFTSMFSNKPSKCRKLHNIANSVIILDEPQTLPIEQLQPIIDALKSYNLLFCTSILMTTASQPALNGNYKYASSSLYGLDKFVEIIPREWDLHKVLKRADIELIEEEHSPETIAKELIKHKKVLCIVNTRKDAKRVFEALPKEGLTIHLSRMMCTEHLQESIAEVKKALANDNIDTIRVVATQLLEAGVDIDFPVVYRQEAGLDSILQAAGRCNREGKLNKATTYVFKFPTKHLGFLEHCCYAFQSLPEDSDWQSPETMQEYFKQLYSRAETFDKNDIRSSLHKSIYPSFKEGAQKFSLIDNDGSVTVYINYKESPSLISQLETEGPSYELLKKLSRYAVNVNLQDFKTLAEGGFIRVIDNNFYYIEDREQYNDKVGLTLNNHWLEETLLV